MEIETAPRHPAPTPWGRLLLFVVLFGPVTLLVLLPIGLGLERYVMTGSSMDGSIDRGSIAFERVVPVSDLRVGDVITYPHPEAEGDDALVTHRIVSIQPDEIRTRGDAKAAVDPWVVHPDAPTMSRVEFTVPWIGWAYLLLFRAQGWVLTLGSAAVLVVLMTRRLRRPPASVRQPEPARSEPGDDANEAPVTQVNPRDSAADPAADPAADSATDSATRGAKR
jgi:signal peptidase